MKKFGIILILIICFFAVGLNYGCSQSSNNGEVLYTVKDGVVTGLTEMGASRDTLVVPDKIDEQIIVAIGDSAFAGQTALTSITLPDSIVSIDDDAFSGCSALKTVNLPSGITSLGADVFKGCDNLTYNIYDNCKYLGNSEKPYLVLMAVNDNSITNCDINDGAKIVYNKAFSECSSLKTVAFGDSVKIVGKRAFNKCSALASVTFNDGVEKIDEKAFGECSALTNLVLSDSVSYVGNNAFQGCLELTDISIPSGIVHLGDYAFKECEKLKLNAHDNAFYLGNSQNPCVVLYKAKDTNITACQINDKTKIIYDSAFASCKKIDGELIIPDSVTKINNYAFNNVREMDSIKIGSGVLIIGNRAFFNCWSMETIVIPDNVKELGSHIFSHTRGTDGYVSLQNVIIGSGVEYIGPNAFEFSEKLKTVTFKNTSGWTAGIKAFTDEELKNPQEVAKLFTVNYLNSTWKRA